MKDADSKYRLRFLKLRPQNPFLGKFAAKKSKLSVLSENWYTWYLKDADSYSNISFLNFKSYFPFWANLGLKSQSCPVLAENWHTDCLDVDSYSYITFLSFQPKILFLDKFGPKNSKLFILTKNCSFLFWQQFFELPTLDPFLGKFGLKKSKVFVLPENWHTRTCTYSISKMLILFSILVFSNTKPKSGECWFLFWD